jgi:hypothetical protein
VGPRAGLEQEEKLAPAGNQTPAVLLVARRNTDWANLKNYVYATDKHKIVSLDFLAVVTINF